MTSLIETVIRDGVRTGELDDAHPHFTAVLVPGLVRSVILHRPRELDPPRLTAHICGLLEHGLVRRNPS